MNRSPRRSGGPDDRTPPSPPTTADPPPSTPRPTDDNLSPDDVPRLDWERRFLADRNPAITAATIAVALTAATYSDGKTGRNIRPSVPTLAAQTRLGESTVRKHLDLLCRLGHLVKTARASGNRWHGPGTGRAARYRLAIHDGATPVAPTQPKGRSAGSTVSPKRRYQDAVTPLPDGPNGATASRTTKYRPNQDQPTARASTEEWPALRDAAERAAAFIAKPDWSVNRCRDALAALDDSGMITSPAGYVAHFVKVRTPRDLIAALRKGLPAASSPTPTPPRFVRDNRTSVDSDPEHRQREIARFRRDQAAKRGADCAS